MSSFLLGFIAELTEEMPLIMIPQVRVQPLICVFIFISLSLS